MCLLSLGLHVSIWLYATSINATIKLSGNDQGTIQTYYLYNVDFPENNMTWIINENVPCDLGVLNYIEVIANSHNSLQIDYLDFIQYEYKQYVDPSYPDYGYDFISQYYQYSSNDTCDGTCCISTEEEPQCDEITSKVFNLYKEMDCNVNHCVLHQESVYTPPTTQDETPDPYCQDGIKGKDAICCHSQCIDSSGNQQCGGSGCSSLGLGYDYCCTATIIQNSRSCDTYSAPCINYSEYVEESDGDSSENSSNSSKKKWYEREWWEYLLIATSSVSIIVVIVVIIQYLSCNRLVEKPQPEEQGEVSIEIV